MEKCVDLVQMPGGRTIVVIKQPGSVRHSQTGQPIIKIEMAVYEAEVLYHQLAEAIDEHNHQQSR